MTCPVFHLCTGFLLLLQQISGLNNTNGHQKSITGLTGQNQGVGRAALLPEALGELLSSCYQLHTFLAQGPPLRFQSHFAGSPLPPCPIAKDSCDYTGPT